MNRQERRRLKSQVRNDVDSQVILDALHKSWAKIIGTDVGQSVEEATASIRSLWDAGWLKAWKAPDGTLRPLMCDPETGEPVPGYLEAWEESSKTPKPGGDLHRADPGSGSEN